MKIGVLGGTFNPPHLGHTHAAKAARKALGLDLVLFVPTNQPPHKAVPEGSATTQQRLEMAMLAAQDAGAQVSTVELDRGGKSYTADTLDGLRKLYPNDELWLITGTDMFLTLHKWYEPQRIFEAANIAVVARNFSGKEEIAKQKEFLCREFGARVDIVDAEIVEISSTELRDGIDADENNYLCAQVLEYIRKNNLYQKVGDTVES